MKNCNFIQNVKNFFTKHFFDEKWRCLVCGKEVFNSSAFCPECEKALPFNDEFICEHCGRRLKSSALVCSTCKNKITEIDKGRSCFDYQPPITSLIYKMKYDGEKYLTKIFAEYLEVVYYKNYFNADYLTFVPMTRKSERKRGYNHSKLLCENLSNKIGVPIFYDIEKVKETPNQASLSKEGRRVNLTNAFKITKYNQINGKKILIVDDVTTTGATARAIAKRLKSRGASEVFLLTIASVAPIDKY